MRLVNVFLIFSVLLALFGSSAAAQTSAARPPFRYGIIVSNTSNYPEVTKMGFGWVKLYVSWRDIEPSPGVFSSGGYPDNAVSQARNNNLHIIMLVFGTPSWASGSSSTDLTIPPTYDHAADFGTFMGNLAAHYQGQVDAYEIWNEENVNGTWGGESPDPVLYTNMLKTAYPAVKSADANALVISGGVANTGDGNPPQAIGDLIYLQDILQQGAASYVDAIGIHPYPGACAPEATSCNSPPGTFFRRAEAEHNTVVANGGGNLPLWITEAGYFSQPGAIDPNAAGCNGGNGLGGFTAYEVDENTKASWVVDAYTYAYNNWPWLGAFFLMNLDLSQGSYATCDPVRFWSILTASGGETPAYNALKNMVKYTPGVTINSPTNGQTSGTVSVTGTVSDPAASGNPIIDAVVVSVDVPYGSSSHLGTATFSGNSFTATVDVTKLSAYQTHTMYIYIHTSVGGWTTNTVGFQVQPMVNVTPSSLFFWVDPTQGTGQAATLSVARNDGPGGVPGLTTTPRQGTSWLSATPSGTSSSPTISVTVDASGLSPGTHTSSFSVTSNDSTTAGYFKNFPISVLVTIMVGPRHNIFIPAVQNVPLGLP